MTDTELRIALHETARSLAIAKTAAAQGDWVKAERALLAAQERNNTLLREIGLKLLIEFRDEQVVRKQETTAAAGGSMELPTMSLNQSQAQSSLTMLGARQRGDRD